MIKINLVPQEELEKEAKRKTIILLGAAGSVLVAVGMLYFLTRFAVDRTVTMKLNGLQMQLRKYQNIADEVKRLRDMADTLEKRKGVIETLMKGRLLYPQFMEEFLDLLPPAVWVTSLNTTSSANIITLNMSCMSFDKFMVADFIANLESSQKFSAIEIGNISSSGSGMQETHVFQIRCQYKTTF
ncbi:MAG: PilN domain-containing protein [Elusimicrobiota bacterium]